MAVIGLPPDPITPTTANCEAPENMSKDKRQACSTEKPFATAAAPNATPLAPTVMETLSESRKVGEKCLDTRTFCRINAGADRGK